MRYYYSLRSVDRQLKEGKRSVFYFFPDRGVIKVTRRSLPAVKRALKEKFSGKD